MASPNGTEQKAGLKILIVGAGIGGLTAAIALRKQGHHVQILSNRGLLLRPELPFTLPRMRMAEEEALLTYKYLPATGPENKGKAAEEYPVIYDAAADENKPQVLKTYKAQKASFAIDSLDWEQLPTLHHVISRLADLPIYDIVEAKVVEGEGVPDLAGAGPIV